MTSSLLSSKFLVILVVLLSCSNVFAEEPSSPTTETETPATFGSDYVKKYSELICSGNTYCQSALFATRQFLNVLGRELLKIKIPDFLNANDDNDAQVLPVTDSQNEQPIIIETPPTFPPQVPLGIKVDEEIPVVTENVPETVSEPEPVPVLLPVTNQEPSKTETDTKAEPLEIENVLDTGKSVLETEPVPSPLPVPVPVPVQEPIVVGTAETISKPSQVPIQSEAAQNSQEIDYDPLSTLTEPQPETQAETIINVRVTRDAYYNTIEDVLHQDHGEPLTKLIEDLENGGEVYEEDYITNFNNVNLENQGHENNNTIDGPQLQQAENENQNQAQQSYDTQINRDTFSPEISININYRENPDNVESQINTAQNDLGREFEKHNQYLEPAARLSEVTGFEPSQNEDLDFNSAENYIGENEAQSYYAEAQAQNVNRLDTHAQTEDQFPTQAQTQTEDKLPTHTQTQTQSKDQFLTYAQTQQESIQSQHLPPVGNIVPTETIGQNPTTAPVPPLVQPEPQVAYETEDDYYDPETETTQEQKQTGKYAQDEFEDDYDDEEEDLTEVPRIPSHESYTYIPRERDPRVEL